MNLDVFRTIPNSLRVAEVLRSYILIGKGITGTHLHASYADVEYSHLDLILSQDQAEIHSQKMRGDIYLVTGEQSILI